MTLTQDYPIAVLPSNERYAESIKGVEELVGIGEFPERVLRFKRLSAAGSGGMRLKLALTEQDIEPNGGTGYVRCYRARAAVGTPYAADSGQLLAELLWMDNDESISEGIEVLLAFFTDLTETDNTTGAILSESNSDYVEVYSDTDASTRLSWSSLDGASFVEFKATITDFTTDRPILAAFDDGTDPATTGSNSSAMFFEATTAKLRWHIGGTTSGVNSVESLAAFGLADATEHTYRIEHDGAGTFTMYRDGTLFDTDTLTLASGGWIDSSVDLGLWDQTGTDRYMDGTLRDFKVRVDSSWLFSFPFNEQAGTAITSSVGVGSGVLSSGDAPAVWASNSGSGKSGWLIIGADCESQADTTGEPV